MKRYSVTLRDIERAVVRKTGTNRNLFSSVRRNFELEPRDFTPERTTVWSFKSRGGWATHSGDYRGNWSPFIPRNLLLRYSNPGDLVLDPFCGGGTTPVEAKLLGRRCIARDIVPAAVETTLRNLSFSVPPQMALGHDSLRIYEPVVQVGDARELTGIADSSVDLVCTHPPYSDIVHYSDGIEGDISFHPLDSFLVDMECVAKECFRVLKPGKHCAILIGDMRKNKRVVPLGFMTIQRFLEQGFVLRDLIIKRQHNCRTTGYWYSSSVRYNFLLLAQEYLPIFLKPDDKTTPMMSTETAECTCRRLSLDELEHPAALECKTTWVFDSANYERLLLGNIVARYGGLHTLAIDAAHSCYDTSCHGADAADPEQFDMVYIRLPVRHQVDAYVVELLRRIENCVRQFGHVVIRASDYRVGDLTVCPALEVWQLLGPTFRIRELIVVVCSDPDLSSTRPEELAIAHEYLLVFQKDMPK
ncbi:MAG: methyltransferase domain-containing protein [Candidatus Thorarchaeota archaeon]|nr:methyltransferase domain-containing protein [Candidatus Thorarchaeota archaeon]